jgi:hypothetical protein
VMSGGRGMLMPIFTFTPAIVGIGTTIDNAKKIVPRSNLFISLPPYDANILLLYNGQLIPYSAFSLSLYFPLPRYIR